MKLLAEILTGPLFYVDVEEDATVRDLKKKIGLQENLPIERLILILEVDEHRYLSMDSDEVSIKSYGAHSSSRVYIFFGPPDTNVPPRSPSTPQYPVGNNVPPRSPSTPQYPVGNNVPSPSSQP